MDGMRIYDVPGRGLAWYREGQQPEGAKPWKPKAEPKPKAVKPKNKAVKPEDK